MQTEPSKAASPKRRRRFQFRLRTLFVLMTVVAVTAMIWRTWGLPYYSIGYSDSEMMYHGFYIREGNLASLIATSFELIVILILLRSPLFRHRDRVSTRSYLSTRSPVVNVQQLVAGR